MLSKKIDTYTAFWQEIVTPDYEAFKAKIDDVRLAFHLAISLFHMVDWVYEDNNAYINSNFVFKDRNGATKAVSNEKDFANALRDINPNFELIRGIANAAKHLQLRQAAKAHHGHAPSHAANTAVDGGYGVGPYGGTPRVMLEGPGNNHLEFLSIADDIRNMWLQLEEKHNWIL